MSSFSFTGKLPDDWEGDIYASLVQVVGQRPMLINEQPSDGTFHATIERVHQADIADVRSAIEALGIEILKK